MSESQRGLSPVVGVALMFVIVVALAATVGSLVLGFDDALSDPAPSVQFETAYDPTGDDNSGRPYVNFSHETGSAVDGKRLLVVDGDGNSVTWNDVWTGGPEVESGEYVHIDGYGSDDALNQVSPGETYRLVWKSGDGATQTLGSYEVP